GGLRADHAGRAFARGLRRGTARCARHGVPRARPRARRAPARARARGRRGPHPPRAAHAPLPAQPAVRPAGPVPHGVLARHEPVHAAVVGRIRTVLRTHRDQAELLFAELVEEHMVSLRDTIERFGDVARELRPVVAAAPMLVPHLAPPTRSVDLLVVDAADHLDLEVVLPALARARQVVVVGDAKSASGSAVRSLAKVLPHVPLRVGDTRRDPYLTAFLAEHGYEGVLEPVPLPRSTPLVGFSLVDGKGMPDADSGAVVSTRAEVEHVVELV